MGGHCVRSARFVEGELNREKSVCWSPRKLDAGWCDFRSQQRTHQYHNWNHSRRRRRFRPDITGGGTGNRIGRYNIDQQVTPIRVKFDSGEEIMKRYLCGAVLVLVGLTLVAGAAETQIGRTQTKHTLQTSDGGPIVTCRPGTNCDPSTQLRQMASDGGPIVTCRPGTNCDPSTQLQRMASDGGPIVTCRPGTNCDPSTQLQQIASDGGPIVTCRPGTNCDPSTQLRQMASGGGLTSSKSPHLAIS